MIRVKNLCKSYAKVAVLKGLNLEVPAGKTLIILGRSGVGKSVLLRHITGLEKPDSGTVEVDGVPISALKRRELNDAMQNFGMLFQSSALFDSLTVGENVGFYLKEHKERNSYTFSEIKEQVALALTNVGLGGLENQMPSELSGGQKRRAALARLIIYRPKIMLYDEPTTGLDPITAMHINQLIADTHHSLAATTIIVTHDLQSALTLGDLFALHHDGQIVSVDNLNSFLQSNNPLIQEFLQNAIIKSKYTALIPKNKEVNAYA